MIVKKSFDEMLEFEEVLSRYVDDDFDNGFFYIKFMPEDQPLLEKYVTNFSIYGTSPFTPQILGLLPKTPIFAVLHNTDYRTIHLLHINCDTLVANRILGLFLDQGLPMHIDYMDNGWMKFYCRR